MKKLEVIAFDYALCRKQFEEFRAWLAGRMSYRNATTYCPSSGASKRSFREFRMWVG